MAKVSYCLLSDHRINILALKNLFGDVPYKTRKICTSLEYEKVQYKATVIVLLLHSLTL